MFIDRRLAGPYGHNEAYYMMGPFQAGTKQQGPQSASTAAQRYRKALAALDAACRDKFGGKTFRFIRRALTHSDGFQRRSYLNMYNVSYGWTEACEVPTFTSQIVLQMGWKSLDL